MANYKDIQGFYIQNLTSDPTPFAQAQAIVDGVIDDAQDTWDNDNVDGETSAEKIERLGAKPVDITLP